MPRLKLLRQPLGVALLIIAVLAALLGGVLSEYVYRGATVTWDESSYLFQSHLFADGKIKHPAPELGVELERGMIIAHPEQGWLSRYPFLHSLWMVPGVMFGVPRLMILVAAFLSIVGMGYLGVALGLRVLVLPIMLATTSIFLAMHGTLLSHTSGLTAVIAICVCYVQWQKTRRWGFALGAGLLWAAYFNNRTYTAALIAIPFGLDALAQLRPANWRHYGGQVLIFAAAAASGFVAFMIYNKLAVGDWLTSTYLFYNPTQNLGFGPRAGSVIHTVELGLQNTEANVRALDNWLYGFRYSLIVVLILAALGLTRRWTFLFLASCLSVVLGYVAFWYPGVHNAGPVYYFELLPFLLAGAGIGINRILNRLPRRAVIPVSAVLIIGVCVSGVEFMSVQRRDQGQLQLLKRTVLDTIARAPAGAVIIFRNMDRQAIHECALNRHGMQSDPLILVDKKRHWNDQAAIYEHMFPGRALYEIDGSDVSELHTVDPVVMTDVTLEPSGAHRKCGENIMCSESGKLIRRHRDGSSADWSFFGAYARLLPGKYSADFSISLTACNTNNPVVLDVYQCDTATTIAIENVSRSPSNAVVSLDFEVAVVTEIEPRIRYGGSGELVVRSVRVYDRPAELDAGLSQHPTNP